MRDELDALFRGLQSKAAVNYHLGGVVEGLMDLNPLFGQEGGSSKRVSTRSFIRKSKPRLHAAMDHLDRFGMVIGNLERFYQKLFSHPELDLENKVQFEGAARSQVISLKRLHGKQKETLTAVTHLFLKLSRQHLREERRKK